MTTTDPLRAALAEALSSMKWKWLGWADTSYDPRRMEAFGNVADAILANPAVLAALDRSDRQPLPFSEVTTLLGITQTDTSNPAEDCADCARLGVLCGRHSAFTGPMADRSDPAVGLRAALVEALPDALSAATELDKSFAYSDEPGSPYVMALADLLSEHPRLARRSPCGAFGDHDWSSTGSPTYCRSCRIIFPAWQAAQRAATPTASPTEDES